MPEPQNTSPSETQRASDVTLQRSNPTEDAASQRDTAGEEIRDPEKKRLHEEAVSHKKRAKELEAQLKAYQDKEEAAKVAALSDIEKANKKAADLEAKVQQYQKQLVAAEVRLASKEKGIINPALIAPVIADKLEFGDDGMPTNLDSVLDELIKANPFLVDKPAEQTVSPAQTARNTNAPALPAMNTRRTNIASPTQLPPGKRPKLSELL